VGSAMADLDGFVADFTRPWSRHIRLARVLLFGSNARGEAGPGSDVDILVVSPDLRGRDHLESATLARQCLPLPREFDVAALLRTPEQLAAAEPDRFLATILADAVLVFPEPAQ